MRNPLVNSSSIVSAIFCIAAALPAMSQTHASGASRTLGDRPDLNGIWQALNTANWDPEAHPARPSLVVALGAVGAEAGGLSVVDGGTIPYLAAALEQKKENFKNRLTADPEVSCYLPGVPRAAYMPYPFQIIQSDKAIAMVYEYDGAVRNIYFKDPVRHPAMHG